VWALTANALPSADFVCIFSLRHAAKHATVARAAHEHTAAAVDLGTQARWHNAIADTHGVTLASSWPQRCPDGDRHAKQTDTAFDLTRTRNQVARQRLAW
jgi:hypothetical protein